MDILNLLTELREQREWVTQAIVVLQRLANSRGPKRRDPGLRRRVRYSSSVRT